MKLSEMTNDQVADVMVRLSPAIASITQDEKAVEAIEEYKKMYRLPLIIAVGKVLPMLLSTLLIDHKQDMYTIVSVLTGVPAAEVGPKGFPWTYNALKDSYDDVLSVFFPSSGAATKNAGKK